MRSVRRVLQISLVVVLVLAIFGGGWLVGRLGIGSAVNPASLTDLERQFTERMRDVTLVGSFTVAGREDRPPRPDRYDISSVEKVGDDLWRFTAGMQCCGVNGAIPIVVPMRWNGDTPMIMMTDTSLPGLGTFTARVFFYGDRYPARGSTAMLAGTWPDESRSRRPPIGNAFLGRRLHGSSRAPPLHLACGGGAGGRAPGETA